MGSQQRYANQRGNEGLEAEEIEEIEKQKSQSTGRDVRERQREAERMGGGSDQLLGDNSNRSCRHVAVGSLLLGAVGRKGKWN